MGADTDLNQEEIRALVSVVRQLVKNTQELPAQITYLEERFKEDLDTVIEFQKEQARSIKDHNKILFGDGENHKGILGRQATIEDRFRLLWGAIGIFGTAVIIAFANMIAKRFNL